MATNVTWDGTTYSIPASGEINWPNLSNFLIALGTKAATSITSINAIRAVLTTPITVSATSDYTVVAKLTVPAAVAANLPAGVAGQTFVILDGTGDARANNITITPFAGDTIGGAATLVLDHDGQAAVIQYVGTDWKVLVKTLPSGTIQTADLRSGSTTGSGNIVLATSPALVTPTGIVKGDVGLGNVDNTSDATKDAAATTLTNKTITSPLGLVKADVGLGNVDNTSDATKDAATATLTNKTLTGNIAVSLVSGAATATLPTTTGTLATLANAETLSNKTLTAPAITGAIDVLQSAAPATPSASHLAVYVSSVDGKVHTKDSAGTDSVLGASGSGELNLVANPSDVVGWLDANDSSTLVTTTTAGDLPLSGIVATALKLTSGTSATRTEATLADTFSYAFTTPASYAVKTKIEFWLRPGTNFLDNEWTVSIYAGATRQPLTTDASAVTYIPNALGKFTTYFDAVASTAYTLRFTRTVNAGTNAGVLNLTNVIVGPGIQPQGAVVSYIGQVTVTPSAGFGTVTASRADAWRTGNKMRLTGRWTSGTVSATTASIALPTGYTLDTTQLGSASLNIGTFISLRTAAGTIYSTDAGGVAFYDGSTTGSVFFTDTTGTVSGVYTKRGGSSIAQSTGGFDFSIEIPIAEWAGSGTVNLAQNDVEYVYNTSGITAKNVINTTDFGYGPSGALIGSIDSSSVAANEYTGFTVQYQTPLQDGDSQVVEFNDPAGGVAWIPATSIFPIGSLVGSVRYGCTINSVTDKTAVVLFGNGGLTYAQPTWANIATWKWRVKKISGGQAVGFGAFQAASSTNPAGISGLVPALGLPGRTDGSAVAAGYVGEYLSSALIRSSATSYTSATYTDVTAVTLGVGIWLVSGSTGMRPSSGTPGITFLVGYISNTANTGTASANARAWSEQGSEKEVISPVSATYAAATDLTIDIPPFPVIVASGTLQMRIGSRCDFSIGTMTQYGSVWATRIA